MTKTPFLKSISLKDYIGDIVVVVIGVLLALAVGEWVNGLDKRAETRSYLEAIIQDFEENQEIATEGLRAEEFFALNGQWLLDLSSGRQTTDDPNRLAMAIETSYYRYANPYLKMAWDDLISSGGLDYLDDAELRREIGRFYRFQEQRQDWDEEWLDHILDYRSEAKFVLDPDVRLEVFRTWTTFGEDNSADMHLEDVRVGDLLASLRAADRIENRLVDVIAIREVSVTFYRDDLKKIESILQHLRSNLSAL